MGARLKHAAALRFNAPRVGTVLALVLSTACGLLGFLGGLGRVDLTLYDFAAEVARRKASPDILLVTIDDESMARLGRWPWPRAVHAALLDKLQGARAIGLDIIFSEPDRFNPAADAELAAAIRRRGNVVLPVVLSTSYSDLAQRPIQALDQAAAQRGFNNLHLDSDAVVRRVAWSAGSAQARWEHFALAMLRAGGEGDLVERFRSKLAGAAYALIPFAGPPGTLRAVSYHTVLEDGLPPQELQGKYVLVGSWATGLADAFPTPVSHRSNGMSGLEITGNLLQAAREGEAWRTAGRLQAGLACALPVLLLCLLLPRLSPRQGLLAAVVAPVVWIAIVVLALRFGHIWFAPGAALLGLVLAYPLWSWRSQEAALRFMDRELERLAREYPPVLEEAGAGRRLSTLRAPSLQERVQELQRALARVRNLRSFLAEGLEGIPDATLVFDRAGRLQFRNRATAGYYRVMGLRPPRPGVTVTELLAHTLPDPQAREAIHAALVNAQAGSTGGRPWHLDMEVQDVAERHLILKAAAIHTEQGEYAGTVLTLSDITPIRMAEQRRKEALHFLSHDMRAPQNAILALVALNEDSGDAAQQSHALKRIAQLAHRTLKLLDSFTSLARAESAELQMVDVDLAEILYEVVDDAWAPASRRNITVSVREPVPRAHLSGDQAMLARAVGNLLDNAIKYSPDGSKVECGIRRSGPFWELTVSDEGPGVVPEDERRIFQAFVRGPRHANANPGSVGLGLAFVRAVAQRHGGQVWIERDRPVGATFVLRLRAAQTCETGGGDDGVPVDVEPTETSLPHA